MMRNPVLYILGMSIHGKSYEATVIDIYIYICVNYNDLTATSLEIMVNKGNHPQMAQEFRLVKYCNLSYPYIYIYVLMIYQSKNVDHIF